LPSKELLTFGWTGPRKEPTAKRGLDNSTLVCGQGSLRRHRVADRIALHLQPGFDAGSEIETGKGLVDAP
jgi:hypothetical protein